MINPDMKFTASITLKGDARVTDSKFTVVTSKAGTQEFVPIRSGSTYTAHLSPLYTDHNTSSSSTVSIWFYYMKGGRWEKIPVCLGINIDPSGYVYDAATNNRIDGALCTLYYKAPGEGDDKWRVWEAHLYDQVNPQVTSAEGEYGWMVPDGFVYEVRVTNTGYTPYTTRTDPSYGPIAVPPERTDINIPLRKPGDSGASDSPKVSMVIGSTEMRIFDEVVQMDVAPYINADGRTMLPLTYVAQAFGISKENVSWDNKTKTATIINGSDTISFTVGNNVMYVNEEATHMNTITENIDGRVCVSVFYIGQALGITTGWDKATKTVTLYR